MSNKQLGQPNSKSRTQQLRAQRRSIVAELAELDRPIEQMSSTSNATLPTPSPISRSRDRSTECGVSRTPSRIASNLLTAMTTPAVRLIAEDRPNCRLRNNGIEADAGHTFTGARVGSGDQVWFRPSLAPDAHSPPPTLARSARPGAVAIIDTRSSGALGHIRRLGIKDRSILLSPSLGLSARKKATRARLASQRKRKAPRLRSLMKASPA